MSVNVCECVWMCVNVCKCLWMCVNVCKCEKMCVNVCECVWMCVMYECFWKLLDVICFRDFGIKICPFWDPFWVILEALGDHFCTPEASWSASWPLGHPGNLPGLSQERLWEPPGPFRSGFWANLASTWANLEPTWNNFGANLRQLGANLASSWTKKRSSGPSGSKLEAIRRDLDAHKAT